MRTNADCSSTTTCVTLDADYYSPLKRNVLKRYVYLKEVLQADVMTSIPVSPPRRVRTPILICPSAKEEENGCFGRSPMNALQLPVPVAVDDANMNESCGSGNGSCEGDHGHSGPLSGLDCLEKGESVLCQEVKSVSVALQKEHADGVNHDVSIRDDTPEGDKRVDDAVAEQNKPVTMSVPEKPVEIATTEQNKPVAVTAEQKERTPTASTQQSDPQPSPNHPPQSASPPATATTSPPNKPSFFSLLFKWFHFFSPVS